MVVRASPLDKDHYENNPLDRIKELERRVRALENSELSGVAGPPGATGPAGPTGSPGPGAPTPLTQGDVLVVDATPAITTLPIGNAHEILKVNAGGTDPGWEAFDWDEMSGVGGADMVHDHSSAAEGGATLNPTLVDLNGNADAVVLDADGDTTISAPTDDQIDLEAGGSDVVSITPAGLTLGDTEHDIFFSTASQLLDEWLGGWSPLGWGDYHSFNVENVMPAIFSAWSTTPAATENYYYTGHFLRARSTGAQVNVTCLLYTVAVRQIIQATLLAENASMEAGLRCDNGSDDTFVEAYIKAGVGTYTNYSNALFYRWQEASGGITTTQLSDPFPPMMTAVQLRSSAAYPNNQFYVQAGFPMNWVATINFAGNWTPTRTGLFVRNTTASGSRGALFHNFGGTG